MDFVTGLNRLLRINQIIGGDDDDITTFDDTQHAADIELAQIAIQDELSSLVSDSLIPYEKTSDSITLSTGTRVYSLASDFVRFYGSKPSFYDSTDNVRIYELPGGEDAIKDSDYQYKTNTGTPHWWYWDSTTSKKVAFYYSPTSDYNGRSLTYDYEKSVTVTDESDTLPFHTNQEAQSFILCASRRFKVIDESLIVNKMEDDPIYVSSKSTLLNLLRPTNPSRYYGRQF